MEAANILLQRNYPEIYDSTQSKPIFIPEIFIPNCTGFLHGQLDTFKNLLDNSDLNDKDKQIEKDAAKGDFAERQFYDELKKTLEEEESQMVILQGTKMIIPRCNQIRKENQNKVEQEADFIIINKKYQYIMTLEIKYNLFAEGEVKEISVKKGVEQLAKIKSILETLFCADIDAEKWKFIGAIGYMKMADHVECCKKCKKFIFEPKDLENFFKQLHSGNLGDFDEQKSNNEDYNFLIRNLIYTVFSGKAPLTRDKIVEESTKRIVDHKWEETQSKSNRIRMNQGNFRLVF